MSSGFDENEPRRLAQCVHINVPAFCCGRQRERSDRQALLALEQPGYLSTEGENVDLGDAWEVEVEAATFEGDRLACVTGLPAQSLSVRLEPVAAQRFLKAGSSNDVLEDATILLDCSDRADVVIVASH